MIGGRLQGGAPRASPDCEVMGLEGGNVDTPVPAALLSESVMRLAESIESAVPVELADGMHGDDDSLIALAEALPRLANAAALAFSSLAGSVERLDAEEAAELVSASISRVDGARLGEAVNSLSRVVIRLYESDPELLSRGGVAVTADTIEALDFGKLRKYLTYRARARTGYGCHAIAMMGKEPVALINLASLLPEYVNNGLALLNQLLGIVTFPPEAITYAVLQAAQEVRWDELGRAFNSVFGLAEAFQRGDMLLGDGSSRVAEVLTGISEDLVRSLDLKEASNAVSTVCDNLEPAVTSLLATALQTEDGALAVGGALLSVSNLVIRCASGVLERAAALPPEVIARMSVGVREGFAGRELGTTVSSALALFNRFAADDPELLGSMLGGVISGVDPGQAGAAGKALATGVGSALRSDASEGDHAAPEALASAANNALASFNRLSAGDPDIVARSLDRFLDALDQEQLQRAARSASSCLAEAALRKPGVARALAGSLFSAAFKLVKGYLKGIWTGRVKGAR